jgi:hypothetical protein
MATTDDDPLAAHKRSLEEEYFRKQDRDLIEKMRRAAEAARTRRDLEGKTGLHDPALLSELQDLGFTPDTVSLLPLVPVVQVAWAEGGVSKAERELIVTLARARGIAEGSDADRQLGDWLAHQPHPSVFTRATRLIRAMLDSGEVSDLSADDLVKQAERIAAASGGMFGIGSVSADERALLAKISEQLKTRSS